MSLKVLDRLISRVPSYRARQLLRRVTGGQPELLPPTFDVGQFTYGWEAIKVLDYGDGTKLRVGNFCSIAGMTVSLGGNHHHEFATTFPFGHKFIEDLGGTEISAGSYSHGDVIIGNDVWIGKDAFIMSGVTIGHGAVVAARSHVVKSVAPYDIVGGNPARKIRSRFAPEIVDLLLALRWWDLPLEQVREVAPTLSRPPTVETLKSLVAKYRF